MRLCCFNPSQVQFTLKYSAPGSNFCFNPSQVQFTLNFNFPVSIPHRFNSHHSNLSVSIPHRFNSHGALKRYLREKVVSIPHRFNSHHLQVLVGWNIWLVSIPHRFNSHLSIQSNRQIKNKGFNPSQVQFTHIYHFSIHMQLSRFNPSQVQFTPLFCGANAAPY
jgi:hypothetical protein